MYSDIRTSKINMKAHHNDITSDIYILDYPNPVIFVSS